MSSYSITDSCIGCTLCAKNCPVGAITGALKQQHSIDPGRCIRCGLCGRLCAKGAILDEKGNPTQRELKKDWPRPVVRESVCVGCSVCIESCPKFVLELSQPKFHGDISVFAVPVREADCIGCGLCAKACPIDAIVMCKPGEAPPPIIDKKKEGLFVSVNKAYCRIYQGAIKVSNYFLGYHMPKYIEGPGCIKDLPSLIRKTGAGHPLLVTGPNITKRGLNKGLLDALAAEGIPCTVYSNVGPNPTSDMVEEGLKLYKENGCDSIIAFGGGSPMDCAKAIGARVVRPNKSVAQLQGLLKVMKKIPPYFAVPTTAGTGSETTVAAVITDSATHRKAAINDTHLIPEYAVLDPELTVGLPPMTTATTGMDALSHAVEAFTNHTYNTKLEDDLARQAVKLIHDNLFLAYQDGTNMQARQNMQKAAFFAGRAFTRGCVGYVHAVGHTVSGLHNIPHGLAMAVILPHVMRQFGPAVYHRLAILADDCSLGGATEQEKAELFIRWMDKMNRDMGIPAGLDMIEDKDIPQMIEWAMKEGNPLYPVPVIWDAEGFRTLITTVQKAK